MDARVRYDALSRKIDKPKKKNNSSEDSTDKDGLMEYFPANQAHTKVKP